MSTTASSESTTNSMKVLQERIHLILLSLIILAGLRMVSGQDILPPLAPQIQRWLNQAMPEASSKIQSFILLIPMLYQRLLL